MRDLQITTSDPIVDKVSYVTASLTVDSVTYQARMRGRGNYTWFLPKKPYRVKLDKSTAMFGFPKSRDWALLANMLDESNIRTALAYEIGRRIGRWAPRSVFCEVTLNGSYQGLYQFIESVEVQPGRLEIRKMSTNDTLGAVLTGPYVLEQDAYFVDPGWITPLGSEVNYDVPDVVGVPPQEAYIQNWINSFERLLVTGDVAWLQYADLPSWADWYLLQELTEPGRVVLWPPWDFDQSLGGWGAQQIPRSGWWTRLKRDQRNNWLMYAVRSPVFVGLLNHRWKTIFLPALADLDTYITALAEELREAQARDRAKWFGRPPALHHTAPSISSWLQARTGWLTTNL